MSISTSQWKLRPALSILSLLLLSLISTVAFGQRKVISKPSAIKIVNFDWQLDATVNEVKFYHAIITCDGAKAVLLRFDNQNAYPVSISWKEKFATQMEDKTIGARVKTLVIPVGVTASAGCSDRLNQEAIVKSEDVNPNYVADIKTFNFADIIVERAK